MRVAQGLLRDLPRRGLCNVARVLKPQALVVPSLKDRAYVIGVAGASASGKTTICNKISRALDNRRCMLLSMDCFYKGIPDDCDDPGEYDFDHPDAIDFRLMLRTLNKLIAKKRARVPDYDFESHKRQATSHLVGPAEVIIVEGIYAFLDSRIRKLMNMRVFVHEDADICLVRRIRRDVASRGREIDDVLMQYERFVKPAYEDLVSPTKRYADIIIPRGHKNDVAVDLLVEHLTEKLNVDAAYVLT
eukprot:Plantae.Rhodophyta-Purpureofilum_apyrenoidigerum.ctg19071.p1 GENE.Plantae.Rhodophyta-Purpureofilum_apyrenoidigerum.ctg19071~~Plantae.Rhodophyta-Purpureofilum_apyrenoidigerum.ctg19071.p1  ORF type:complete len:246 (+),score=43.74 Plantae.Rhodophyta-Purpureofilum_apyrenoidigerum.ctg19071:287-1024(+)